MKNKTSFTIDILLCITLISSLFYCLVTSFDIKTEWYIIVVPTAIFCTIYGLLASLVKKSGVLFISVAITMIVFLFTLLFSLESILEQLSYVITQALKLLSQYLPVQNKIILGHNLVADFMTANYNFFPFLNPNLTDCNIKHRIPSVHQPFYHIKKKINST